MAACHTSFLFFKSWFSSSLIPSISRSWTPQRFTRNRAKNGALAALKYRSNIPNNSLSPLKTLNFYDYAYIYSFSVKYAWQCQKGKQLRILKVNGQCITTKITSNSDYFKPGISSHNSCISGALYQLYLTNLLYILGILIILEKVKDTSVMECLNSCQSLWQWPRGLTAGSSLKIPNFTNLQLTISGCSSKKSYSKSF